MSEGTRSKRIQLAGAPGHGLPADGARGRVVLRGGRVLDPAAGFSEPADLYVEDGAIVGYDRPGSFAELEHAREIDVTGLLVVPGLIDMHVHLREPGYEYKETVRTGCAAAAAGGFATIACMANTNPVNDSGAVTQYILDQSRIVAGAEVYPIGAVSLGLRGETLAEIGEMQRAGIVAVSDDGHPIADSGLMRRALEYCRMFQMTLIAHEEDPHLAAGGVMNEGPVAHRLGLRGIPAAAEEVMVARDIALAELTGGRLHIAHVSTARAVEHVRQARARGVQVTAEAAPHHLWLDDEAVAEYDTNAKMNPPLRSAEDVAAVRVGLADGTVGVIASDHAPHHRDEKEVEFDAAAMGIVGLETTLPLVLALVRDNHLGLMDAVTRLTTGPAEVLGIARGTLAAGAVANVTVIDLGRAWTVDAGGFRSKGRNTPFHGWDVTGRAALTMVAGRIVYQETDPRLGVGPTTASTRAVARSAS